VLGFAKSNDLGDSLLPASKRRKPVRRVKPKTAKRRKSGARPRTRGRRSQPKEKHFNALMVFLMFLYMLRLMDEKQFKRLQRDLSPRKKNRTKRRQRK